MAARRFEASGSRVGLASRLAIAALVLTLSGCGMFGSRGKPVSDLVSPPAAESIPLTRLWQVSLGARSPLGFVPVVSAGDVWAAAQDGTVVRLDAQTGELRWRTRLRTPLSTGVGADGGTSVVVARDGTLIALDAEGKLAWRVPVGSEVIVPPVVAEGRVLLLAGDNRLMAFNARDGEALWVLQRPGPALSLRESGGILAQGGKVFAGLPGGRLLTVDAATGVVGWEQSFAVPRGATDVERIADLVGTPRLQAESVCVASYQGRLGCVDVVTGRPIWQRDFSSVGGLDVDAQGVVSVTSDDAPRSYSATGDMRWEQQNFQGRRLTGPRISGGWVFFGERAGHLLLLERTEGRYVGQAATDGSPIIAAPQLLGAATVLVQTSAGGLFALRVR